MSVPAREKTGAYYNYYTESRHDVEVSCTFSFPYSTLQCEANSLFYLCFESYFSFPTRTAQRFLSNFQSLCVFLFLFIYFWHINLRLNNPFFSLFSFLLLALLHKSILNFPSHPIFQPKLLSESIVPLFLSGLYVHFLFYFLPFLLFSCQYLLGSFFSITLFLAVCFDPYRTKQ
jgi:hypothetical protein